MLLIVRNPLDTIVSLFHLWNTGNHVSKVEFDCEKEYPEYWDFWVKDTTAHIKNWFKIVMLDTKLRRVPGLFTRFEDLVNDPQPELENMMRFFCNIADIKGTNAQRKGLEVIKQGREKTKTYELKDNTLQFNGHVKRFT